MLLRDGSGAVSEELVLTVTEIALKLIVHLWTLPKLNEVLFCQHLTYQFGTTFVP